MDQNTAQSLIFPNQKYEFSCRQIIHVNDNDEQGNICQNRKTNLYSEIKVFGSGPISVVHLFLYFFSYPKTSLKSSFFTTMQLKLAGKVSALVG